MFDEVTEMFDRSMRWAKIELITMLTFIVSILLTNNLLIIVVAFNLWFVLLVTRPIFVDRLLNKKFGEIEGAFRVLKLLGLIDYDISGGKKDKKTKEQKKALLERMKETWGKITFSPQPEPQLVKIKYN